MEYYRISLYLHRLMGASINNGLDATTQWLVSLNNITCLVYCAARAHEVTESIINIRSNNNA